MYIAKLYYIICIILYYIPILPAITGIHADPIHSYTPTTVYVYTNKHTYIHIFINIIY